MTREEALNKAINIVAYFEAHFAKSKEAREEAANIIEALEQEPKTGHWIDDNDGFGTKCSECGKWYSHSYLTRQEVIYCCRCGAKMAESEGV